LAEELHWTLG
jgi:hypothetical protein